MGTKNSLKQPPFTPAWWDYFLDETKGMTYPVTLKSVFPSEVAVLKELFLDSFKNLIREKESPYSFYINHDNRNDLKKLISEGFENEKPNSLDEFVASFFSDLNFAIIAHHTNAFNRDYATRVHSYIAPLFEKIGKPLRGVDLNVFSGNYGWTPLGIHRDGVGENVIHLHLGPGTKTMYLWNDDTVETIRGASLDTAIEKADFKFDIEPGDVFFMPEGIHHIGCTPTFSTAITVWFVKPTQELLRKRLFYELLNLSQEEIKDDSKIIGLEKNITDENFIESIVNHCSSGLSKSEYANFPFEKAVRHKIKEHIYSLQSNLMYRRPLQNFIAQDAALHDSDTIKADLPYKIEYFIDGETNKMYLFSKGRKIVTDFDHQVVSLIERLNKGESINVEEIICQQGSSIKKVFLEKLFRNDTVLKEENSFVKN